MSRSVQESTPHDGPVELLLVSASPVELDEDSEEVVEDEPVVVDVESSPVLPEVAVGGGSGGPVIVAIVSPGGARMHVSSTQNSPSSQCALVSHGRPSVLGIGHAASIRSAARLRTGRTIAPPSFVRPSSAKLRRSAACESRG